MIEMEGKLQTNPAKDVVSLLETEQCVIPSHLPQV